MAELHITFLLGWCAMYMCVCLFM